MTDGAEATTARLSREAVLRNALAIIDELGYDQLSMRRLADRLGCGTMTLYHYVSGRDDLLSGIAGLLLDEMEARHEPSESWEAVAERAAASYLAVALRHPSAFHILAFAPYEDPPLQRHAVRLVQALTDAGLDQRRALGLLSALDSFTSGFLLLRAEQSYTVSGPGASPDGRLSAYTGEEMLGDEAWRRGLAIVIAGAREVLGAPD